MKKLLLVILVSLLLIGCSENRVLLDRLINKGSEESADFEPNFCSELMYEWEGLFNGVGYDVFSNGQLRKERNYKEGKRDGLSKWWYENGQLRFEGNYKNGQSDGIRKDWYENGQLKYESNF